MSQHEEDATSSVATSTPIVEHLTRIQWVFIAFFAVWVIIMTTQTYFYMSIQFNIVEVKIILAALFLQL